ncbi:ankyrin repeat domain-containing protein 40-like [Cyrtonyx montezumae]|uniref:ankyrin repeat domain-containing protein 40-like n=1 Tax=Cyrtonyx montezumae TaxID=9017 RepID=UPI0032DA877E
MSGGAEELQERLREAAALGDAEEVRRLLAAGADVNSRNEIDGWTCLHWACKRSHAPVVSLLLDAGADPRIPTAAGQLAAQLAGRAHVRRILGVTEENGCEGVGEVQPPAALSRAPTAPLPRGSADESSPCRVPQPPNGRAPISPTSRSETSPPSAAAQVESDRAPTPRGSEDGVPAADTAAQPRSALPSSGRQHPALSSALLALGRAAPGALQPFFLTGTWPYNVRELVLKVRVQNLRDDDFIEIELDRQELTYRDLLRVSCCELGVNPLQVERIRKLPNTVLRKDKDVARLQDFQELELVLVRSDSSPFRNAAPTLSERPCYNSSASRLTY